MIGHQLNNNPSPEQRAADVLGISCMGVNASRIYEDLEREYESCQEGMSLPTDSTTILSSLLGLSSKDKWIGSRAQKLYGDGKRLPGRDFGGTYCYFGWSGTRLKESALWEQQQKEIQRSEKNKVLDHRCFELEFDSLNLAYRYESKPILCLHIRGTSGLLLELDAASQKYRRIGVYRRGSSRRGDDLSGWEEKTVTLI